MPSRFDSWPSCRHWDVNSSDTLSGLTVLCMLWCSVLFLERLAFLLQEDVVLKGLRRSGCCSLPLGVLESSEVL